MELSFSNFLKEIDEINLLVDHIDSLENTPEFLKIRSATSKSAILVSCGLFERFLKDSFMEYICEINNLKIPRGYIKSVLWERNRTNTLEVLQWIKEGKINADYKKIVIDYASSCKDDRKANKPVLIKEAFAFTRSNPGVKTIIEMFNNIGVKRVFETDFLKIKFSDVNLVKSQLNSFIELRHTFAHGLPNVTIPSLNEVNGYLTFIRDLSFVFNEVLNNELTSIECSYYTSCFKLII